MDRAYKALRPRGMPQTAKELLRQPGYCTWRRVPGGVRPAVRQLRASLALYNRGLVLSRGIRRLRVA